MAHNDRFLGPLLAPLDSIRSPLQAEEQRLLDAGRKELENQEAQRSEWCFEWKELGVRVSKDLQL